MTSNVFCYVGPRANARLVYSSKTERGEVKFGDHWHLNDEVYRLDVLSDWIGLLQEEYDRTLKESRYPKLALSCLGHDR